MMMNKMLRLLLMLLQANSAQQQPGVVGGDPSVPGAQAAPSETSRLIVMDDVNDESMINLMLPLRETESTGCRPIPTRSTRSSR